MITAPRQTEEERREKRRLAAAAYRALHPAEERERLALLRAERRRRGLCLERVGHVLTAEDLRCGHVRCFSCREKRLRRGTANDSRETTWRA